MNGEDDYGEVSQADPERFMGPVDHENANAADRRKQADVGRPQQA